MAGDSYGQSAPVTRTPARLGLRVGLLLAATAAIGVGFVAYVLYARGVFEATHRVTLVLESADGIAVGMDVTFSGFPIGRVVRLALAEDGKARVHVEVPRREARWLRKSSQFVVEVPVVGAARIRVYSNILQDPPLADGAVVNAHRGDAAESLPQVLQTAREILENVERITNPGSHLEASLKNARAVTERMAGRQGLLGAALGGEDNARKVLAAIDRANALLATLGGAASRLDGVVARADSRVFGEGGIAEETRKAAVQANAVLADVRERLKAVDAILANAQAASGNVAAATSDLAALRAEVEASLRKVGSLIDELNRKWPFERDTKVRLP